MCPFALFHIQTYIAHAGKRNIIAALSHGVEVEISNDFFGGIVYINLRCAVHGQQLNAVGRITVGLIDDRSRHFSGGKRHRCPVVARVTNAVNLYSGAVMLV